MKKKLCLIIPLSFALVIILAIVGVLLLNKDSQTQIEENVLTDVVFIGNGKTDYVFLIQEEQTEYVSFAMQELEYFIYEATGITITFVEDENMLTQSTKIISVGNTNLYQASGLSIDSSLKSDTLLVETIGTNVFINGASDSAILYGCYEFLEWTFNLEVYATDEFYIDTNVKNLNLREFKILEVPTFDVRSCGMYDITIDKTYRYRMRQDYHNDGWIYFSHSNFTILPPSTYYDEHPDWYNENCDQLCLTNDEMRAEYTKNVIQLVKDNPDCDHIMLGQEDVSTFCYCDECMKEIETYGESGVNMRFVNAVAADVQDYIDKSEPGRVFYCVTFAYQKTEAAPVKIVNNEYVPIDDSVIPLDNVKVMIAPIYSNCSTDLYDEVYNKETAELLHQWDVVANGHIYIWIYNKMFHQYFVPFNNFGTTYDNYQILEELGVEFVYHQGNKETQSAGMQELREYVQSKLMWNNDQNYDELAYDFIENYYKDASDNFKRYYDLIRTTYSIWESQGICFYPTGNDSYLQFTSDLWTRNYLDQLDAIFVDMLEDIEHYRDTDIEMFELLETRIKKERLTVQYMYMYFYIDQFSYVDATYILDEIEQVCFDTGITDYAENYYTYSTKKISVIVAEWRDSIKQ